MARPLRIEYPGAYYHVMNRGNRREDIFLTDKDRKVFLAGLAIDYDWFLSAYFGGDSAKSRRRCREHVYKAIEGEIENPFEEVVHQSILGTQTLLNG